MTTDSEHPALVVVPGQRNNEQPRARPTRRTLTRRFLDMIGPAKPRPPSTALLHEDRCRTPDAEPEWIDEGYGRWIRTCSCTTEYWTAPPEPEQRLKITPEMHRHMPPDCDATAKVVDEPTNGERYTRCYACMTSTHYLDLRHMNERERQDYMTGLIR